MAWHSMALNLPLVTAYLMKYGVPERGIFTALFILEWNMRADDSSTVG